MTIHHLGVRHHSPACARLVETTIREVRPAHVLVEGPADVNDRLDELLLGHDLPIAVFTSYRDAERHHVSWAPFCAHSPEWVALTVGREVGAGVRFCDLPAWHLALAGRTNRYADAEARYARAVSELCAAFGVDHVDALWDHLVEVAPADGLAERLATYFDGLRGDAEAGEGDTAREAHMARWVAAAQADAGDRDVVVVTGGFHRPALVRAAATLAEPDGWPEVPAFPPDAVGGSYLVPYSFARLDAFDGYQSGMPSPRYYQRLWEGGPEAAATEVVTAVAERLRGRGVPVSTADLVAARTLALGLARLRGHATPARLDVLDGLVSALVTDAMDRPPPWARRGPLAPGTDPVVVEMVHALAGDEVGRLHPDTPHPPLVADVAAAVAAAGVPDEGTVTVDLASAEGRATSRVLHRLQTLAIPGVERRHGPRPGGAPALDEEWRLVDHEHRLPALIEAGAFGATLDAAAGVVLADRLGGAGGDAVVVADVLFTAVLCGLDGPMAAALDRATDAVATVTDLGGLGTLLATTLGLWRHDRLLGAAGDPALARVVDGAVGRTLWLVEAVRGGPAPADDGRLTALVAVRDAVVHAEAVLTVDRADVVGLARRATAADRPPDLRGAGIGLASVLADGTDDDVVAAVRAAARPEVLGDLLAGLFAVAREQVIAPDGELVGVLDEVVGGFAEPDFLVALPSLRLAFSWFPPREREAIAERLLARRGVRGSAASLVRARVDPAVVARARAVEARVDELLAREGLLA